MITVTLRNAAGQETALEVPEPNAIDAARTAKHRQVADTGDKSWRVLRSIGQRGT